MTAGGQMSGNMRFSPVQGRYLKTDGGDMIVCGDAPYVMINETGDNGVFGGLKSGDLIEVTYEYALETYPREDARTQPDAHRARRNRRYPGKCA